MTTLKKFTYALLILVIILVVTRFGIQFWLQSKIPKLISEKTNYQLDFQEMDVSLLKGSVHLHQVSLTPKSEREAQQKSTVNSTISSIEIDGIQIFKYLFEKKISVSSVKINSSDITYVKHSIKQVSTAQKTSQPLDITIGKFSIENAKINYIHTASDSTQINKTLSIDSLYFSLENVVYNSATASQKIPISYQNPQLKIAHLIYQGDKVYKMEAQNIAFANQNFEANDFRMIPQITRQEFLNQLKMEKDLFTILTKKISISQIDWGFEGNDFYFTTPQVTLTEVNTNIFRSKVPPDNPAKRLLYSAQLRKIPFRMEVNKVVIQNSKLEYEEEIERGEPGKLSFTNFNAAVLNVNSGYQKTTLPKVDISIICTFMHASRFKVHWAFDPLDTSDAFTIQGNLYNYPLEHTTPFIRPRANVSAEGTAKQIAFNLYGDDNLAHGDFLMDYENLKITLYKKDSSKKTKLASFVANIILKNSNTKQVEIKTVERQYDRSFFNFLWLCVEQGLQQTVII